MTVRIKLTVNSFLNVILMYCLLRFGLVFTSRWAFFGLTLVVAVGMAVVLTNALLDKRYAGKLFQSNTFFLGLNILLVIVAKSFSHDSFYSGLATNYTNQLIVLFLHWGFYMYMQRRDGKTQRLLAGFYLLAVVVSTVYTFYVAMNGEANVIRNTAFGEYDPRFPLAYGGFDFIYGLVLVYVILLTVLINGKGKIKVGARICLIVLLAMIGATIIISGYSTAFTLILLFTCLTAPQKWSTRSMLIVVLLFFLFVIPVPLVKLILSIPFMPELTSSRLGEMILSFSGQGNSAYLTEDGERLDRLFWSLRAFAEHPFLGVAATNTGIVLGNHTEWIDQLARYGVFAAVCNTTFWITTSNKMKSFVQKNTITYKCMNNAFLVYLILGFLNPISMVVTAAPLFLLCPFAEKLFLQEDYQKD